MQRLMMHIRRLGSLLMTAALVMPQPASSQSADSLSLDVVVEAVRSANPSVLALRQRAAAAAERAPQAGALPDPMLSVGMMNRPVDDLGPDHPMTMNSVQWSQMLPWRGKRGFARERAELLAEADGLDAAEAEVVAIARAKGLFYRLARTDRATAVMESTRALLRDFVDVATSRYAVGSGIQQDILQAQVAVAETTADLAALRETRTGLAAQLNALMGRTAGESVGPVRLPEIGGPPPGLESLLERAVQGRPALRSVDRRIRAAAAGLQLAERQSYPDLTFTVGYGQRPRFDDLVTVMVGLSLPVWSGSKQEPQRREMEALRSMEEAREGDLIAQTRANLTELRARMERARTLHELYRTSILPQANAAVESALSSYRVGSVDYMTLLSNQMTVNRYEIESLDLTVDYHSAMAEIDALVGPEPGGSS